MQWAPSTVWGRGSGSLWEHEQQGAGQGDLSLLPALPKLRPTNIPAPPTPHPAGHGQGPQEQEGAKSWGVLASLLSAITTPSLIPGTQEGCQGFAATEAGQDHQKAELESRQGPSFRLSIHLVHPSIPPSLNAYVGLLCARGWGMKSTQMYYVKGLCPSHLLADPPPPGVTVRPPQLAGGLPPLKPMGVTENPSRS